MNHRRCCESTEVKIEVKLDLFRVNFLNETLVCCPPILNHKTVAGAQVAVAQTQPPVAGAMTQPPFRGMTGWAMHRIVHTTAQLADHSAKEYSVMYRARLLAATTKFCLSPS
jgi:hypothetical protein